jgi:hypothetical protein
MYRNLKLPPHWQNMGNVSPAMDANMAAAVPPYVTAQSHDRGSAIGCCNEYIKKCSRVDSFMKPVTFADVNGFIG